MLIFPPTLQPQASSHRGLALETKARYPIPNEVSARPSPKHHAQYARLVSQHKQWVPRKSPSGEYNCFGMVWAARRTGIYEEAALARIIKDDGYRVIPPQDAVFGDLVKYALEDGSTTHVGVYSHDLPPLAASGRPFKIILSKLNDSLGEVFHQLQDAWFPYHTIAFLTDRSAE